MHKSVVPDYRNAEVWKEFNIIGCDYLVKVAANNDEYGYAIGNELYETNEEATVTSTAHQGYKFVNWTVEDSKDNPHSFTVIEDVKLVASFEKDETGIETVETSVIKIYSNPTNGELRITD